MVRWIRNNRTRCAKCRRTFHLHDLHMTKTSNLCDECYNIYKEGKFTVQKSVC